jgi:hypothetical protein
MAHYHHYDTHPKRDWGFHVYCTTCGFALHSRHLKLAISQGATATEAALAVEVGDYVKTSEPTHSI